MRIRIEVVSQRCDFRCDPKEERFPLQYVIIHYLPPLQPLNLPTILSPPVSAASRSTCSADTSNTSDITCHLTPSTSSTDCHTIFMHR